MLKTKRFLAFDATLALAAVLSAPSAQVLAQPGAAATPSPVLTQDDS